MRYPLGGGASVALTGGYVLAAYLSHSDGDVESALSDYERWLRPVVDDVQKLPPGTKHVAYPQTRFGLKLSGLLTTALAAKPLAPLMARLTQAAGTDQSLPHLDEVVGPEPG